MKLKNLYGSKSVSIFRSKKIIIAVIGILATISALVGVLSFYGTNTGGFTVSIDDDLNGVGIVLSNSKTDTIGTTNLTANLLTSAQPIYGDSIREFEVLEKDGKYESVTGNYIGYTFYVHNNGTLDCYIESMLKITSTSHNVEKAVRFWVFYNDEGNVYKKKDEVETNYTSSLDVKEFETDSVVCTKELDAIAPGEYHKISIIMWLEGEDPDCTDTGENSILGGALKIAMTFSAYEKTIF